MKRPRLKTPVVVHRTISHKPQPAVPEMHISVPATQVKTEPIEPTPNLAAATDVGETKSIATLERSVKTEPASLLTNFDLLQSNVSCEIQLKTEEKEDIPFNTDPDMSLSLDANIELAHQELDATNFTTERSTEELLDALLTHSAYESTCSSIAQELYPASFISGITHYR